MKSICFTGHRNIKVTDELKNRLYSQLEMLIQGGAEIFIAGGAKGFDLLCEETVITLKKKYPHIKLHIILPCPEAEQTEDWTETEKEQYRRILLSADYTEICSEHKTKGCMKKRNARLVELADVCVCYYNTRRIRTGTGQTVRMAKEKEIKIINLCC